MIIALLKIICIKSGADFIKDYSTKMENIITFSTSNFFTDCFVDLSIINLIKILRFAYKVYVVRSLSVSSRNVQDDSESSLSVSSRNVQDDSESSDELETIEKILEPYFGKDLTNRIVKQMERNRHMDEIGKDFYGYLDRFWFTHPMASDGWDEGDNPWIPITDVLEEESYENNQLFQDPIPFHAVLTVVPLTGIILPLTPSVALGLALNEIDPDEDWEMYQRVERIKYFVEELGVPSRDDDLDDILD